ncbi:Hypothetical predicted protein [Octopus vulgaris]|uniref:Uncharacterized protein n=1 Tax=Octopus vulgaris TaxID=6645 RepID=A0AA36BRW1_OCTVU|nr:Hypothetical predicted protein [Octopus vulgaris]
MTRMKIIHLNARMQNEEHKVKQQPMKTTGDNVVQDLRKDELDLIIKPLNVKLLEGIRPGMKEPKTGI